MSDKIKFWITPNPDPQYKRNKENAFDYGVKYPVIDVDHVQARLLVVLSNGQMRYTGSDAFLVADGIRPEPIEEKVEKEEFIKLSAKEYQALSKEEKEAYQQAKKEWESE